MLIRKRLRLAISLAVLVGIVSAVLVVGLRTEEYDRVTSPDGLYIAVATYHSYRACVPTMPGGGGDKSGFITVYTREGKSCGRASVGMVNYLYSLRWDDDTVSLPAEASWNLVACKGRQIRQ